MYNFLAFNAQVADQNNWSAARGFCNEQFHVPDFDLFNADGEIKQHVIIFNIVIITKSLFTCLNWEWDVRLIRLYL